MKNNLLKIVIATAVTFTANIDAIAAKCARASASGEDDIDGDLSGSHQPAGTDSNGNPIPAHCLQLWCPPYHTGTCVPDKNSDSQCMAEDTEKPCTSYRRPGPTCSTGMTNEDPSNGYTTVTTNATVQDVKITTKPCSQV